MDSIDRKMIKAGLACLGMYILIYIVVSITEEIMWAILY